MKIKPAQEYLLVEKVKVEEKTSGGIILDTRDLRTYYAVKVLDAAEDARQDLVGKTVLVGRGNEQTNLMEKEGTQLLTYKAVLAIVE